MKPLTRKEFFMAKAAGQTVPDLEPITREEYFLNQIAESGGGGGGGGAGAVICELDYNIETGIMTARMTAGELFAAIENGSTVIFHVADEDNSLYGYLYVLGASKMPGMYMFTINSGESFGTLTAMSDDGYPTNETT